MLIDPDEKPIPDEAIRIITQHAQQNARFKQEATSETLAMLFCFGIATSLAIALMFMYLIY